MEIYRRGQFGRILAGLFLLGMILTMAIFFLQKGKATAPLTARNLLVAEGFLAAALLCLTHMTVRVTEGFIEARFSPGLLKKRVPLDEISGIETASIPWYSLGIKRIRRGWAWSVAPGPAVDLLLKNGRIVRIGTDDQKGLFEAVEKASGQAFRTPS